jgi:hypothetical protein
MDKTSKLLSIVSVVGFVIISILSLLAGKFGVEWAKSMMDTILPMIIQCWIINFTTMMNYYFGSSVQSPPSPTRPADSDAINLVNEVK